MTVTGWIQLLAPVALLVTLTPVVGGYMVHVFQGERAPLAPVLSCANAFAPQTRTASKPA